MVHTISIIELLIGIAYDHLKTQKNELKKSSFPEIYNNLFSRNRDSYTFEELMEIIRLNRLDQYLDSAHEKVYSQLLKTNSRMCLPKSFTKRSLHTKIQRKKIDYLNPDDQIVI